MTRLAQAARCATALALLFFVVFLVNLLELDGHALHNLWIAALAFVAAVGLHMADDLRQPTP